MILSENFDLAGLDADGVGTVTIEALRGAGIRTLGQYLRTPTPVLRDIRHVSDRKIDAIDAALAYFGKREVVRRRRLGWYQFSPTYIFNDDRRAAHTVFHYLSVATAYKRAPAGVCGQFVDPPIFSFHEPALRELCGKCLEKIDAEVRRHA